ncbi:Fe(3+)-hydroxamate ABC transporter permease FhuB [Marinobacter sp. JSM 1782161]|uniref:Fe(3+)-hydroxamate ABC transporter permease FhuB n=1 Tax=Marinobacter sp. JSM 1782161 TaxID=2685906 RepID=UPI0014034808|nr:Fe(3+)-hydroxamate ABC transporter permease FhuB [Marinobacter sp. JSM 1782161]
MTTAVLRWTPGRACGLLALACLVLACFSLAHQLPSVSPMAWPATLLSNSADSIRLTLIHYSWLPRLSIALLAGAALGLAGTLMQQTLRNPLASPTTLGVASGAQLAMLLATLYAPGLMALGSQWVAMAGGGLALLLVFALSWRSGLAPLVVVLAGLVINLYLGALSTTLVLFHPDALQGVMVWAAGSLSQNDWDGVIGLLPELVVSGLLAAMLVRPLAVLDVGATQAQSLGVSLRKLRFFGLGLAVFITGCVVGTVGIIGFVGLAAPAIVRLLGARTLGQRLFWAPVLGALLLLATDLLLLNLAETLPTLIPTGAMTGALGAPILLWLIRRLTHGTGRVPSTEKQSVGAGLGGRVRLWHVGVLLVLATIMALVLNRGVDGWQLAAWAQWDAIQQWRLPRVLAAAGAGTLLALAGTLVQRVSANPMASPEVLGISGGTAIGLIVVIMTVPGVGMPTLVVAGFLSALATLAVLLFLNRRSGFQPDRMLLTGIAITALFEPLRTLILANGDPRGQQLTAWMSGSTYYVTLSGAIPVVILAIVMALILPHLRRWLELLPLGATSARALGVNVDRARLALLGLVAFLTACATLIVGPLSFVGLLAPHLARLLGFARAREQVIGAALLGGVLMVGADWLGRQVLFPEELPAGLVSALIGGGFFLWRLRKL